MQVFALAIRELRVDVTNDMTMDVGQSAIHLMRTGEVEANLITLNESAKLSYIDELVDRKRSGPEKGTLQAADLKFHTREFERLTAELESAYEASKLPEMSLARGELNQLLVRLRLQPPGSLSIDPSSTSS